MYGVPADLPISRFVGDHLSQMGIYVGGVHFVFGRSGTISVEGYWELHNRNGDLVDKAQVHGERETYRLHCVLNQDVIESEIHPPDWFAITFANGSRLTVFDDNPKYESFQISPDGIIV